MKKNCRLDSSEGYDGTKCATPLQFCTKTSRLPAPAEQWVQRHRISTEKMQKQNNNRLSVCQTKATLQTAVRGSFSWNVRYMHCNYKGFQRQGGLMILKWGQFDVWRNLFKRVMCLAVMFLHRSNLASSCRRELFSSLLLWQLTVKAHISHLKHTKKRNKVKVLW